jgi:deoxyribose-phosphate aldolase
MQITKSELARLIDHTLLKPDAKPDDIVNICEEAKHFKFGAVCVNPCCVSTAGKELAGSSIGVCSVIGFPLGANEPSTKAFEAASALQSGASELDVVINIGFLKGGLLELVKADLAGVIQCARRESPGTIIKIILETCLLTDSEKIIVCKMAVEMGADFVKTSTGWSKSGATISDVALLKQSVGDNAGVKASGGIRNLKSAMAMIDAGATRIGTSSGPSIMGEIEE